MELKERISTIIQENRLKQKQLAALMGVTESYVSTLLSGRNRNVSIPVANLIQEKLGYSARWVLTGEGPKYRQPDRTPGVSQLQKEIIVQLEKMTAGELRAVLAFIRTLDSLKAESTSHTSTESNL